MLALCSYATTHTTDGRDVWPLHTRELHHIYLPTDVGYEAELEVAGT